MPIEHGVAARGKSAAHVLLTTASLWQVTSDCAPSMFAYPPPVTTETKDTGAKVPTAVLSTTAKAKDKAKKKEAEKAVKEGRTTADQVKESSDKTDGGLLQLPHHQLSALHLLPKWLHLLAASLQPSSLK